MNKLFFTASPMQDVLSQPGADKSYLSVNNDRLQYDEPCCFPVLPLIHGYVEQGDHVSVQIVATENHTISQKNYAEVKKRIAELCQKLGAEYEIHLIEIPFDDTVETHLATFKKLIDCVHNGDTVFADITYLGRCLPIVELMALNYAYRTCADCSVQCIAYGNKDFQTGEKFLYEETSLFLMDQIVNELAKSKNRNPLKAIEGILSINACLEDE